MRKGFNRYNDQSQDQQSSNAQQPNLSNINYGIISQFANFSPNNSSYSDAMLMSLFQVVEQQATALSSLMQQMDRMSQKTLQLTQKIREIKATHKEVGNQNHLIDMKESKNCETVATYDIIDSKSLIKILFGPHKQYDYKLQLAQPFELPLYRQRNFSLQIQLVDQESKLVQNQNKIPLSLALYSSQNPPKFIEKNTAGQKILKGYIEQSLHSGSCRFQKIQIKQVTSHFRGGWVFIVIIPCMTPLGGSNNSESYIDYTKIQPLVLQKVIVKAKKLKQSKQKVEGNKQQQNDQEQQKNEQKIYQQ